MKILNCKLLKGKQPKPFGIKMQSFFSPFQGLLGEEERLLSVDKGFDHHH